MNVISLPVTRQAAMNPVLIILLAGVLAMVWQRVDESASAKLAAGLLLCGVSLLLLSVAAAQAVGDVRVSLLWPVGLYFLPRDWTVCPSTRRWAPRSRHAGSVIDRHGRGPVQATLRKCPPVIFFAVLQEGRWPSGP
ncbi:hypothetical protein, partial [Streptomyces violascens]|uniref:hypothetical protein n=1 Tax=Streptomyces violascens TaxID=67381 RepID=UPI0036803753